MTMTGTPPNIAATPRSALSSAAPDVLAEVLRAMRLSGSVFMDGRFTEPFGVISPARWDGAAVMAHLRHISVFHLIARGQCSLEIADGSVHAMKTGDVLLLPFTSSHRFWAGNPDSFAFAPDLVQPGPIPGVDTVQLGGDGEETRIICGFVESAELLAAPLFRTLPQLLVESASDNSVSGFLSSTVSEIIARMDAADASATYLLSRLMEMLFLEVLRRHAARLPPDAKGMLAATGDAVVSRSLSLLHNDPARRWTVEHLAQQAGSSRTVLTERFNRLLGKSPMEYLIHWRIQLAAEKLRSTDIRLAQLAPEAGYESEAAFSRAFKRVMGMSPGQWREIGKA